MLLSWIRSLVIYLILSGLLIRLVPEKNYSRYISFFMGMIMIIILARPIVYIFKIDDSGVSLIKGKVDELMIVGRASGSYSDKDGAGAPLYDSQYYKLSLDEAIRLTCEEAGYQIYKVDVVTDERGQVLSCTIYVGEEIRSDAAQEFENNLKNLIKDVYKIDFDSIYIVRR